MKLTAEKTKQISEGNNEGTLIKCEESVRGGFKYLDMWFKIEGDSVERTIKAGVPSRIEENSTLGKIIASTGRAIIVGEEYDLEDILVGKRFTFIVSKVPGKGANAGKTFLNIVPDSINAVEESE